MVDSSLISYIQQQLRNGYDANTIKNALLQNNYPPQEIDAAFQALSGVSPQQVQQLATYIKQNLAQGYSLQQIQQFLLQQGYPPAAVQQAFQKALKKPFKVSTKSILIVFLSLLIIAIVAATAWFFMNIQTTTEPEISFGINVDLDAVAPGNMLYINNDFVNFPQTRQYPITIYYVLNDDTQTRIDSWQISMGATDPLLKNTKYSVSRTTTSGEYTIDATMNYGTISRQASTAFTVTASKEEIAAAEQRAEEKAAEEAEEAEEQEEEETTETSETVETTYESTVPGQDDYKNLASAKEIAATDPTTAIGYCDLISTQTKMDECYWSVAKTSGDKTYCQTIVADHTRDACWIGFAFDKSDYTVCENIANPFIKQSCDQLKKVAELKAMQST